MRRILGLHIMVVFLALAGAAPVSAAGDAVALLDAGLAAHAAGDYPAARRALRPLAGRGSAIAETLLGVMAAHGQGRPADAAEAVGWWLRAANRGYAPAQLALAKALAAGRGVGADPGRAWVWARLASRGGDAVAGEATLLAGRLERGLDAARLAGLEAERAAWRPWPGA